MEFKGLFSRKNKRPDSEALDRFLESHAGENNCGRSSAPFSSKKAESDYQKLVELWEELEDYPAELDPNLDLNIQQRPKDKYPLRTSMPRLAVAASVVVALSLLFLPFTANNVKEYQTDRGERMQVALDDGSTIQINSASKVSVIYSAKSRLVKVEQGEALFDVAKDKDRMFVVSTNRGFVEAIGTRFNVNLINRNLIVSVTEGKVLVSNGEEELAERAAEIAVAGEQVRVDAKGAIDSVRQVNLEQVLAWVDDKIIFHGESLERAVEQINRYSKHRITILDARLKDLPVYGVFNVGDYEGFLSGLEKSYELNAVKGADNLTYLAYRAKSASD